MIDLLVTTIPSALASLVSSTNGFIAIVFGAVCPIGAMATVSAIAARNDFLCEFLRTITRCLHCFCYYIGNIRVVK